MSGWRLTRVLEFCPFQAVTSLSFHLHTKLTGYLTFSLEGSAEASQPARHAPQEPWVFTGQGSPLGAFWKS